MRVGCGLCVCVRVVVGAELTWAVVAERTLSREIHSRNAGAVTISTSPRCCGRLGRGRLRDGLACTSLHAQGARSPPSALRSLAEAALFPEVTLSCEPPRTGFP